MKRYLTLVPFTGQATAVSWHGSPLVQNQSAQRSGAPLPGLLLRYKVHVDVNLSPVQA